MCSAKGYVRFTPENGHLAAQLDCPLSARAKKMIRNTLLAKKDSKVDEVFKVANENYALAMMGNVVSEEHLETELAILERLDTRIARGMKMLMQSNAMKEIIGASNNKAKIHAIGHSAEG